VTLLIPSEIVQVVPDLFELSLYLACFLFMYPTTLVFAFIGVMHVKAGWLVQATVGMVKMNGSPVKTVSWCLCNSRKLCVCVEDRLTLRYANLM